MMIIHKSIKRFCLLLSIIFITINFSVILVYGFDSTTTNTVRVAFPYQSGMSEIGENGDLSGYNYEYIQRLSEYTGWNLDFVTYNESTNDEAILKAMQMVQNGEADILGPILKNSSSKSMFEFPSKSYGTVYTTLSTLENSNIHESNFYNLPVIRVALLEKATERNAEVFKYLTAEQLNYEVVYCSTPKEQYDAILNNKADVLSGVTLNYFAGTRCIAKFAPRPYYFVSTKGNTQICDEIDSGISELNYTQPFLQNDLQNHYFGDSNGNFTLNDLQKSMLSKKGTLNVLCVLDDAPYAYRNKDGEACGFNVEIINNFAKLAGVEVSYSFCKYADEVKSELGKKDYDLLIGLPLTSEFCAETGMIKSANITTSDNVSFTKTDCTASPNEQTVAIFNGFKNAIDLSKYKNVIYCKNVNESVEYVKNGKADIGFGNRSIVSYYMYENNIDLILSTLIGNEKSINIAISKNMGKDFIFLFNSYLHNLTDAQKTEFYNIGNTHENRNSFAMFIRNKPVLASILLAFLFMIIFALILLWIYIVKIKNNNTSLKQANDAKSEFLSRMSHDIRTPMNVIIGFANKAQEDLENKEEILLDIEKIQTSGKFLLGLINDVLDMSKIESRAMELQLEPYNRKEFESVVHTIMSPIFKEKNIEFSFELPENSPEYVKLDKLRFNQIIFNILSNAAKYTPSGGKIVLKLDYTSVTDTKLNMKVTVKDTGIGMSEEFLEHLFEPFTQENKNHISEREGTGLGLSIVKNLVELMGGTITVSSKQGVGTTFVIQLSADICDAPSSETGHRTQLISDDILNGKRILICEDHPLNSEIAVHLLKNKGMITECAVNGAEGIKKFKSSDVWYFDAILMDIRMPEVDGLEATNIIRKLDRADSNEIPIIAMTANAYSEDRNISKKSGMNEHISKPIDANLLYKVLAEQIALHKKHE